MTSNQLAANIVHSYIFSYTVSDDVTQSAIDLSYMDTLATQLSDMALAIMRDTLTPTINYINAANSSQYYSDWDFIDLYDFCNKILSYSYNVQVKNIALSIQQTLSSAVLHSGYYGYGVDKSWGLSIYFPYTSYDSYYNNTNFAQNTQWNEMFSYLGF